jgi:hypothetical protein
MKIQERLENEILFIKFGNINLEQFIRMVGLKIDGIASVEISSTTNTIISVHKSNARRLEVCFELTLNLYNNFFLNCDRDIKTALKKLSKHSKKYDIELLEVKDSFADGENRFISFKFKPPIKQIFPLSTRKKEISTDTIRDIIGLKKHLDYSVISDRPVNNGWQYIFHVYDIDKFSLHYIDMELQRSKISKDYYIKVFCDKYADIRVVLQNKKSKQFFKNCIPQITIPHLTAILRTNDYALSGAFTYQDEYAAGLKFTNLFLPTINEFLDFDYVVNEIKPYFKEYYHIETNVSENMIRFVDKSVDARYNPEDLSDSIIRIVLEDVKVEKLSIHDATEIIKLHFEQIIDKLVTS